MKTTGDVANDKLQAGTSEARMREMFEKSAVEIWQFQLHMFQREPSGEYFYQAVEMRWKQWQAAFAAGREEGLREAKGKL